MKKVHFTLVLFLLVNLLNAQNPLVKQWDKRFGGTNDEWLSSFEQTNDGGYILAGLSKSGINGDKTQNTYGGADYWIVKIDSLGNKQWDKDFGGTSWDGLNCVHQITGGGYILGGTSTSGISGDKTQSTWGSYDYWIVKTDSTGTKQWDKDFGGMDAETFTEIHQTTDGGYILGGYSNSNASGDKTQNTWGDVDYWIIKVDSLGNKQWDKDFGGTSGDYLLSLQCTKDGGYIMGGMSYSNATGDKTQNVWGYGDYWIVKADSFGNKQWDKDIGGTGGERLTSLQQTSDGGYILGGWSDSPISGDKTQNTWGELDYWIVKIDSLGNKQWDKDFGGTDLDYLYSLKITADGGYLLSGTSESPAGGNKTEDNLGFFQTWFVKTDSTGNLMWEKTVHALGYDEYGTASQTKEGCYVIASHTTAGIGGDKTEPKWDTICNPTCTYDYWIIKFCDTTATTSINEIPNSQPPFSIYPNPTNSTLYLSLNIKENIIITNLLGEIVLEKNAKGKVELDVSFLSKGIYFLKAGNEVRKFVKQ